MGEALRLARTAYEAGEVPVGAVIVRNAKIIARAHNQVELLKDATAHAEILAITQAANSLGDWRLEALHALRDQGTLSHVRRRHHALTLETARVRRS